MTYTFYREPLAHQRRDFERFKDAPYIPLFYDPRGRKTKVIIDIFRYRYAEGDVDALLVFADPNGTHLIWLDELPKDVPPEELGNYRTLAWEAGKTTETKYRRERALALRDHAGPIVATFYCGTLTTQKGWKYVSWLLNKRRAMVVADESSWMCNWNARTKRMLALGGFYKRPPNDMKLTHDQHNVVVKAILDGTPVDEEPVDIFYPTQFLRRGLLGFDSALSFKNRYYEYEMKEVEEERDGQRVIVQQQVKQYNSRTDTEYPIFKGYRNLPELRVKIAEIGSRVRREDISDAPPKTYQSHYFYMTEKQRKIYDRARDEYIMELDRGEKTLENVLLRMTRLQQIARGYYPPERVGVICSTCNGVGDDCEVCEGIGIIVENTKLERIDTRNPAAEALVHEIKVARGPVVIWNRFRQDVTDVIETAREAGRTILRYDGTVPAKDREANYQAFRAGQGDGIAGTITSGLSRGKDLTRATTLIFYSNWFGLRGRRQAEDRAEGLDRTISTDVIDLVAADTRDLHVIEALRAKRSLAAAIVGDPITEWI